MTSNLAPSSTSTSTFQLLFWITASFCHLGTVSGAVYFDVLSGDEFFSDAHNYTISLLEDVVYEVEGRLVSVKPRRNKIVEFAPDFVVNHHLVETSFPSREQYLRYLRVYMEKVVAAAANLYEEPIPPEQAERLMAKTEKVMEGLLLQEGSNDDLVYYGGQSRITHGLIAVRKFKEVPFDGERAIPVLYVVKFGLEEI